MLGAVAVTRHYKALLLSGLKWDSEDQSVSLYNILKAASRAQLTEVKGGKILTSTASNGFAGTFTLPLNGQGLTALAAAEVLGEFLRLFDAAKANLIARGSADPSDDEIFAEMNLLIDQGAAAESFNDFSCIRR